MSSSFQLSGRPLLTCVEEDEGAGEVAWRLCEVTLPAKMPSGMWTSQYLPSRALPLRPGLSQPSTEHGAVATIAAQSCAGTCHSSSAAHAHGSRQTCPEIFGSVWLRLGCGCRGWHAQHRQARSREHAEGERDGRKNTCAQAHHHHSRGLWRVDQLQLSLD